MDGCGYNTKNPKKIDSHASSMIVVNIGDKELDDGSLFSCIEHHTLSHEVGHFLGAGHQTADGHDPVYDYGRPQQISNFDPDFDGKYTLMWTGFSGDTERRDRLNRINYWSNEIFGGSNTNVAKLIAERAPIIAAFRPLPPLTASIGGQWTVVSGTWTQWTGSVNGGLGPYNYYWYRSNQGSSSYTQVSSGTSQDGNNISYGQVVSSNISLKLVVRDAANNSFTDYHDVNAINEDCGPFGCHMFKNISGSSTPETFSMFNNYPNPFNPSTQLRFDVPEQSDVDLEVFNVMGQRVAMLQQGTISAGSYEITFNANSLPSGLYIARFTALGNSGKQFIREIKMQLVK
jgi:hypothetical protein